MLIERLYCSINKIKQRHRVNDCEDMKLVVPTIYIYICIYRQYKLENKPMNNEKIIIKIRCYILVNIS